MTLKYPLSRNHCFGRRWTLALCLFFGLSAAAFGQANQPPVVNAGPDQTINFPDSATLNGSASDDGLPNPPGALTYTWSVVTGPGTVYFADASATNTTAYDENQGVWLQLNGYNMAGSNIWTEDASWHTTNISYGDSFSDGNNSRNTFAK